MHEKNLTVLTLRDIIDRNRDGKIEKQEMKTFLEEINIYASNKHLSELMWLLDINQNE
jgi:Ca2+-binding EF-hand superfamily protein